MDVSDIRVHSLKQTQEKENIIEEVNMLKTAGAKSNDAKDDKSTESKEEKPAAPWKVQTF